MIWLIFKLKIEERMGKECLVCISFHTAEYPLRYPYIKIKEAVTAYREYRVFLLMRFGADERN
jgi:predicted metal-binding protein